MFEPDTSWGARLDSGSCCRRSTLRVCRTCHLTLPRKDSDVRRLDTSTNAGATTKMKGARKCCPGAGQSATARQVDVLFYSFREVRGRECSGRRTGSTCSGGVQGVGRSGRAGPRLPHRVGNVGLTATRSTIRAHKPQARDQGGSRAFVTVGGLV